MGSFPKLQSKLDTICLEYHQIHENLNYDIDSNGEAWLLQKLGEKGLLNNVFDVGANRGDWASKVLEINPDATIHCFEICPPTFRKLSERLSASKTKIILNSFGLSDSLGEIQIKYCPEDDGKTSIVGVLHDLKFQEIKAKVVTGNAYCNDRAIGSIDLLKLDVEGAEPLVLKGFGDMLVPEKIPVVQFEYGLINIVTKFLARDFFQFFEERGYKIGKLFQNRVRFCEYRFQDEDFLGPNYIAASPQRAALLAG